jgi:hypothetical protein
MSQKWDGSLHSRTFSLMSLLLLLMQSLTFSNRYSAVVEDPMAIASVDSHVLLWFAQDGGRL